MKYVVLDIETTGYSKNRHKITELAAIKFKNKKRVGDFETLVNPEIHIKRHITRITGIDDEMVKGKPTIRKALPAFMNFIEDAAIIGHNVSFDRGFLEHNSVKHLKKPMHNDTICTMLLARRLCQELPSKKLGNVCEHLNIVNRQEHRAMGDVEATSKIFHSFLDILAAKKINSTERIMQFQRTSISRLP